MPQITHLCTNLPLLKFNIYSHMKAKLLSRFILFVTPWTIQSVNSPGQNPGVGNHCIIQVILPTQGSNLVLPHCRQILYQLSHKGSPRILQWVAYPFSSRRLSSLPNPEIKPGTPALQVDSLPAELLGKSFNHLNDP